MAPGHPRRRTTAQWIQATPVVRVTLIALRDRPLDDDNLANGFKPLRDAVADALGLDDGSPLYEWTYRQVRSDRPGTVVLIEAL